MVKYFHYPFIVILNAKKSMYDDLMKICRDIRKIDPLFVFYTSRKKNYAVVYCETENEAWKKAVWFSNKTTCVQWFKVMENKFYRGK